MGWIFLVYEFFPYPAEPRLAVPFVLGSGVGTHDSMREYIEPALILLPCADGRKVPNIQGVIYPGYDAGVLGARFTSDAINNIMKGQRAHRHAGVFPYQDRACHV